MLGPLKIKVWNVENHILIHGSKILEIVDNLVNVLIDFFTFTNLKVYDYVIFFKRFRGYRPSAQN